MSEDLMLKCLICFILGWLVSRMMGNGFSVSCSSVNSEPDDCNTAMDKIINTYDTNPTNDDFSMHVKNQFKRENDMEYFLKCVRDNNQAPGDKSTQEFVRYHNSHEYRRAEFTQIVRSFWHMAW